MKAFFFNGHLSTMLMLHLSSIDQWSHMLNVVELLHNLISISLASSKLLKWPAFRPDELLYTQVNDVYWVREREAPGRLENWRMIQWDPLSTQIMARSQVSWVWKQPSSDKLEEYFSAFSFSTVTLKIISEKKCMLSTLQSDYSSPFLSVATH